jgi:hypothetical protein
MGRLPASLIAAFVIAVPTFAAAQPELETLQRGQPRDVARYLERSAGCNHWAGEEAYDAERSAQIDQAIRDLRCTSLDRTKKVLRHRYAHSPKVLRALKAAQHL